MEEGLEGQQTFFRGVLTPWISVMHKGSRLEGWVDECVGGWVGGEVLNLRVGGGQAGHSGPENRQTEKSYLIGGC